MFFERVVNLNSESVLLLGCIHFLLIAFFETAKTMVQNNKDKGCFMNILKSSVHKTWITVRAVLRDIFYATVWAFGVETSCADLSESRPFFVGAQG